MARIDDIKKKAKISMDEMYSCTPESKEVKEDVHTKKSKSVKDGLSTYTNTAIQQKPMYTKKITAYLTEELFKAFNDIYARRMLEGRKTDKTVLMCEAIQLLIESENE